jgi:uncharacterized membrane protein YsdA (DUF1294 family)
MADLIAPSTVLLALLVLNLIACALFGIDKLRARDGQWRTAEATLLRLALLGGTAGAYAGRRLFRHKTRKQPFNRQLRAIALGQGLAIAAVLVWHWGGWRVSDLPFADAAMAQWQVARNALAVLAGPESPIADWPVFH